MRTGDRHSEQSRRWLAQTGQSVATVIAAILVTACLCGTAAGETPETLAEAVRVGEYARAEELARTHLEVHPADARAWFYLGFALAAQGRAGEALPAYREAVGLGLHEYQSLYQLGYAALLAGELELATESLEAAIAERSDAPEAWYRLGRARLEAKALEDAEAAFGQLIEGAPEEPAADEWQERARFQRAIVRIERGRIEAASGDLRWVATHGRNPERKRRAALLLESASQLRRSASRWGLLWLEKTGYDSNVLRLPETSLTRSTEDGAATVTSLLMGSYDVLPDGGLTLRLSGLDVSYPGRREGAVDALLLAAENETRIGERVALLLTGNGEYYWAGREALFWRGGGKLGLRVHAPGDLWLGLGGTYTRIEYRPQVLADLDAHESSGFATLEWRPRRRVRGRLGYRVLSENARADDRSYLENRLRLRGDLRLAARWRLEAEGRVRWRRYDAIDRRFPEKRRDTRLGARSTLYWTPPLRLGPTVTQLLVQGEFDDNDSNISDFDYRRWSLTSGFVVSY